MLNRLGHQQQNGSGKALQSPSDNSQEFNSPHKDIRDSYNALYLKANVVSAFKDIEHKFLI